MTMKRRIAWLFSEDGPPYHLFCLLTRPYLEWRWRRGGAVVCIRPWCRRMIGDEWLLHCDQHAPEYE